MPPKRKRAVSENHGSDVEEPMVRQAATNVGFYDSNIYSKLYTFWRAQVHRGIQNWNCFSTGEAGTSRWSEFCEWAASQEGMAPRGMLAYTTDSSIRRNVRTICDDIAKKARSSRQSMWETIFRARAAYRESNPRASAIIEPARWPRPGAQELGPVNTGISFMPKNARGRRIPLVNATAASNIESTRVGSRAVGIPFGGGIGLAGGGAGTTGAGAGAGAGTTGAGAGAGTTGAGAGAGAGPAGAGAGAGTGAGPTGAAAGPAGAVVSSPRDEAGSSREGGGPAGAGRGRGRGRGRGFPAAKRSKRAGAGPTRARAAAGPVGQR